MIKSQNPVPEVFNDHEDTDQLSNITDLNVIFNANMHSHFSFRNVQLPNSRGTDGDHPPCFPQTVYHNCTSLDNLKRGCQE